MRYSLMVKSVESGPGTAPVAANPAMAARTGAVPMDEGRPWAGDLYEEGPVTDPAQGFARFSGEEDTEAWLDRHPDGTLIGWVREGGDVWRYSDPEAWAADVDGATMQRTDEAVPVADDEEVEDLETEDPAVDPAVDPAAEVPDPNADPATDPNVVPGEIDQADPEVEVDPAAEDDLLDDPAAAEAAEHPEVEETAAAADEEQPADDEHDDDEDDEDDDLPESLKLFRKTEKKHMTGHHNQENHGDWSDGIAPGPQRSSSGTAGTGAGTRPKGGTPKKASIAPDTVKQMSDEDLDAILDSGTLYDQATMEAVASELDTRNPLDGPVREAAADTTPGSPERAAAFDSVIPHEWSAWAAQGAQGRRRRRDKNAEIKDAYLEHVAAQMQRLENAVAGGDMLTREGRAAGYVEDDLFNGNISRAMWKKYAGEEVQRFFASDTGEKRMTLSDFKAEYYPSYAKAKQKAGDRYISEFG